MRQLCLAVGTIGVMAMSVFANLVLAPSRLSLTFPPLGGSTVYSLALASGDSIVADFDSITVGTSQSRVENLVVPGSGTPMDFRGIRAVTTNGSQTDVREFILSSIIPSQLGFNELTVSVDTTFVVKAALTFSTCSDSVTVSSSLVTSFRRNGVPGRLLQRRISKFPPPSQGVNVRIGFPSEPSSPSLTRIHSQVRFGGRCGSGPWMSSTFFESGKTGWIPKLLDSVDFGAVSLIAGATASPSSMLAVGSVSDFSDRASGAGRDLADSLGAPSWALWQSSNKDSILSVSGGGYSGSVEQGQNLAGYHIPWGTSAGWGFWNEFSLPGFSGSIAYGVSKFHFPFMGSDSVAGIQVGVARTSPSSPNDSAVAMAWKSSVLDSVVFPITSSGTYSTPVSMPLRLDLVLKEVGSSDVTNGQAYMSGYQDYYSGAAQLPAMMLSVPAAPFREEISVATGRLTAVMKATSGNLVDPGLLVRRIGDTTGVADAKSFVGSFERKGTGSVMSVSAILYPGTYQIFGTTKTGHGRIRFGSRTVKVSAGDRLVLLDSAGSVKLTALSDNCRSQDSVRFRLDGASSLAGSSASILLDGSLAGSVVLGAQSTSVSVSVAGLQPGAHQLELVLQVAGSTSVNVGAEFLWRGTQPQLAFTNPATDVQDYTSDSYAYSGTLSGTSSELVSFSLNGQPAVASSGVVSGTLLTTSLANPFRAVAKDVCGDSVVVSRVIGRLDHSPVAYFDCNRLQQSAYPGARLGLDGSGSSDPDGSDALAYSWTLNGTSISSLAVDTVAFTGTQQASIALKVTDKFGLNDTKACLVVPGQYFVFHQCGSGNDAPACSVSGDDGPEFGKVFLRSMPGSLFMLFKQCGDDASGSDPWFESSQYLVVDSDGDPTTGNNDGFDVRYRLDYRRNTRADSTVKIEKEVWNGSQWVETSYSFPGGSAITFGVNTSQSQIAYGPTGTVLAWGYGKQVLPDLDTAYSNRLLEMQIPIAAGARLVRWYFDGKKEELGSAQNPFIHTMNSTPLTSYAADGRTCDWLGTACTLPQDDVGGFGAGWSLAANALATAGPDFSVVEQGVNSLKVTPSTTSSSEEIALVGNVVMVDSIKSATAMTVAVKFAVPSNWIVNMHASITLPNGGNSGWGDVNINSSMFSDGAWHDISFTMDKVNLPVIGASFGLNIVLHVQPTSQPGMIYLDNLRFK